MTTSYSLNFELLCRYTREVLEEATAVAEDLPEGWELNVSAASDIVLNHKSGFWVGIEMRGLKVEDRTWRPWRGSVAVAPETRGTLKEAVQYTIKMAERFSKEYFHGKH